MKNGRYFLREQPEGTWIDNIEPWPKVVCDPTVVSQMMDQCMTGQQVDTISDWEEPVKKATEWTANSETFVAPIRKYDL